MSNLLDYSFEHLKEVIDDVRMSYQWHITKDGKIFSIYAENFLGYINLYAKYCFPEKVEKFKQELRNIVYHPMVPQLVIRDKEEAEKVKQIVENNTRAIIEVLYEYINACQIMELYANTNSWDKVEQKLHEQGHSGYTFSGLSNTLILYSPIGVEFIDRFDHTRPDRDKKFRKYYMEAKQRLNEKTKRYQI